MAQSPAEPPLVFIHDWFSDPTTEWSAQVARFGRDYDCNYFRLAGHGDPAEELHQDQPILDHNLSALGNLIQSFARPVRLVAHGIGAGLALRVAALMPERLSCLVVIAPVFRLERLRWLARLCTYLPFLMPVYLLLADPLAEEQGSAWWRMRNRRRCLRGRNAALYLRHGLDGEEPYLADVRVPVFLISGDLDPLAGSRAAERLSEKLPGSRLLRYGHLGHNPHQEEPDLVNSAIQHFLDAHRKEGAWRTLGNWFQRVKKLIVGDAGQD